MQVITKKRCSGLLILLFSSMILLGCNQSPGDTTTPGGDTTPTPSSDATVSNITLSSGSLDQTVQASQTSYTATEGHFLNSVGVTATVSDSHASLDINGSSVASGASTTIPLAEGVNAVTVHVVAEDGTTSQTYTLDVTRQTLADVVQQAYTKASNAGASDQFAYSVAIDGDTMVVGASYEAGDANSTMSSPNDNASGAGGAYVFVRSNGAWTQQAYLKASNAEANDRFGTSVAISGDTAVVGAFSESGDASSTAGSPNNNSIYAGAVYVFTRSNGVWTQQAYLKASNAGVADYFGFSVGVSADTLVVGAKNEAGDVNSTASSPNNNASNAGAAYVFTRSNGVWTQQAYLKASDARINDYFGYSVDISGDAVVVGANEEDSDSSGTATSPNYNALNSGAAYVFTRSNGVWTQQAYLKASNVGAGDWFGTSVAIDSDTVVVGAYIEAGDVNSTAISPNDNASNAGAAYVFVRNSGVWSQQAYLKASNIEAGDSFGSSVAIDGDTVVIGAYGEDGDAASTASSPNNNTSNAGAAYVFSRNSGVWSQQAYLKASNTDISDIFGSSVAIDGDTAVVGANLEKGDATSTASSPNNNATDAGAAYVFR